MFAAGDRSLVAFSRDELFERAVKGGRELVNGNRICLPNVSGPQVAALATSTLVVYAERRCSASTAFPGSTRGVTPASLYGVDAYALAFDASTNSLIATDPKGFLTIYNVPRPASSKP